MFENEIRKNILASKNISAEKTEAAAVKSAPTDDVPSGFNSVGGVMPRVFNDISASPAYSAPAGDIEGGGRSLSFKQAAFARNAESQNEAITLPPVSGDEIKNAVELERRRSGGI